MTAHFGKTQALPLLYFSDELLGDGRLRTGWSFLVWVCACGFIVSPLFWEMADLEGIRYFFFLFSFLIFFALFLALAGLLLQLSPFPLWTLRIWFGLGMAEIGRVIICEWHRERLPYLRGEVPAVCAAGGKDRYHSVLPPVCWNGVCGILWFEETVW